MILVDAYGRIVHANAAGHALLADGSVLRAAGRKLLANDAGAEQALHDVFMAAGSGDAAVGVKGIAVPLAARDGERYVAHVLPLTSGARRRAGTPMRQSRHYSSTRRRCDPPSPPEVIAKLYKLTPTELRVCSPSSKSPACRSRPTPWASPETRSRRICAACSTRPAPTDRPTSSSSLPDSPIRWSIDRNVVAGKVSHGRIWSCINDGPIIPLSVPLAH